MKRSRFGSPEFMEELRTVVMCGSSAGTPQRGFEWMARRLELWDYESISGTFEANDMPQWLPLLQDAGTRGVAGPLLPVLANMNATGLECIATSQRRGGSLRLDSFVGIQDLFL
jgi:hypothetical protein